LSEFNEKEITVLTSNEIKPIMSQCQFDSAANFLGEVKTKIALVDDFFDPDIDNAKKTVAGLTAKKKVYTDVLDKFEKSIKKEMTSFIEISEYERPKNITVRRTTIIDNVDEACLPEEYFMRVVNTKMIEANISNGMAIPGVTTKEKITIAAGKV